jgi:hypothetical protein
VTDRLESRATTEEHSVVVRKTAKAGALALTVQLARALLDNERVRAAAAQWPAAAVTWAKEQNARRSTNREAGGGGITSRFGQRGLERRLAALERNVAVAFRSRAPTPAGASRPPWPRRDGP